MDKLKRLNISSASHHSGIMMTGICLF